MNNIIKTILFSVILVGYHLFIFCQNLKEIITINPIGPITAVNLSADNKYIVCGLKSGDIYVYDTFTGHMIYELKRHRNEVFSIAFLFQKVNQNCLSAGQLLAFHIKSC